MHGNRLVAANLGDCRIVLCNESGGSVKQVTSDHKVSSVTEKKRIKKEAPEAFFEDGRLWGAIMVTRALGDYPYKHLEDEETDKLQFSKALSAVPELKEIKSLSPYRYMVIASDGLWDEQENEEVAEIVQTAAAKKGGVQLAATQLLKSAELYDDTSIIVVDLQRK